jgi:hypothetical protein
LVYVTGLVGSTITSTDLKQNNVFIKQEDIILTNDDWKIVVNIELAFYEELLAKLKDELHQTYNEDTLFTLIHELKQVENLLDKLESEKSAFEEILPCLDTRCAVLNVAGSYFKLLFGTAMIADLESLHNAVEELHEKQENSTLGKQSVDLFENFRCFSTI